MFMLIFLTDINDNDGDDNYNNKRWGKISIALIWRLQCNVLSINILPDISLISAQCFVEASGKTFSANMPVARTL